MKKIRLKTSLAGVLLCALLLSILPILLQSALAAAVPTIANPANTTIHLFDYYVYDN